MDKMSKFIIKILPDAESFVEGPLSRVVNSEAVVVAVTAVTIEGCKRGAQPEVLTIVPSLMLSVVVRMLV